MKAFASFSVVIHSTSLRRLYNLYIKRCHMLRMPISISFFCNFRLKYSESYFTAPIIEISKRHSNMSTHLSEDANVPRLHPHNQMHLLVGKVQRTNGRCERTNAFLIATVRHAVQTLSGPVVGDAQSGHPAKHHQASLASCEHHLNRKNDLKNTSKNLQ